MSERLLGIPRSLALAGVLGLVLAAGLYSRGLGVSLPDYEMSKAATAARAAAFAASQGVDTKAAWPVVQTQSVDSDDLAKLAARFGLAEVRRARATGEIPVPAWRVRLRKDMMTSDLDDDPSGLSVTYDEHGNLLAAQFPRTSSRDPAPPRSEARRVASERLAALGIDLAGYAERTEKAETGVKVSSNDGAVEVGSGDDEDDEGDKGRGRDDAPTKRKFVWERAHPRWPDLKLTVSATVTAAGLASFSRAAKLENAPTPVGLVTRIVEGTIFGLITTFLVIVLMGVFVSRLITRDYVSVWRALAAAAVVAATVVLSGFLGTGMGGSVVELFVGMLFLALFAGLVVWPAWLAGEADAYFAWGQRSTEAAVALLAGGWRARQVARGALEGYFWGWAMLGALAAAAAAVAAIAGPEAVRAPTDMYALDVHPTWLFPVALLPFVLCYAVVYLLFVLAWAHRITKRAWIAIPVAGAVAGLYAGTFDLANVSFGSLPPSPSWALAFGIGTCLIAARRGWLTAATASFAFSAFFYGLAPVAAGATRDATMASVGLVVAALPAAAALVFGPRLADVAVREAPPPRVSKMIEQARREEELSIARRVQSALLPSHDPEVEGFDIAGTCVPAHEVGGDYYDYFPFSDGRFGVAVGDVSGKGVPAAFCMTLTKGFMEVAAAESRDPDAVLSLANTYLRGNLTRGTFVTMAYAVLDLESRAVTCARAGHNPPAILRDGAPPEFVSPPGTALGAAPEGQFAELIESHRIELRRGDTLVLYTDGVTEAMNAAREQFGERRLLETLGRLRDGRSARGLVDDLLGELDAYASDADQHDDITIVVIKAA